MSDISGDIQTAATTLISGCFLYFLTQFFNDLLAGPYREYRKVLGEISYHLVFCANILTNPPGLTDQEELAKVTNEVRQLSARLRAAYSLLSPYRLIRFILGVPNPSQHHQAAGLLIRISNMRIVENGMMIYDDINEVGHLLKIDVGRNPSKKFRRRT